MKTPESKQDPLFVGQMLEELNRNGYQATLIGAVALTLMGSQRVTKDADFLIQEVARDHRELFKLFYDRGFELISKVDKMGNVIRTVDNINVAFAKTQIDQPKSIFFYHYETTLRIDILFDFPFPADEIHKNAKKKKVGGYEIYIASKADLIKMKEIAYANRKKSTDLQDLEFLKSL